MRWTYLGSLLLLKQKLFLLLMRYFVELSYKGTQYCGWQRQPNAPSVQQHIEEQMSIMLRKAITVFGCGRTDTGVHAKQYYLHFEFDEILPEYFVDRLNRMLPKDIAIYRVFEVSDHLHARFNANHRAYEYHIHFDRNPFKLETSFYFSQQKQLNLKLLQEAAQLLTQYTEFFTFCKTHTDVNTMICDIRRSEWEIHENRLVFHIAADRFLRGMVRLIVGMCLNVALGKIKLEEVKTALDQQIRLSKPYSVPPQGLFLTDIRYDFDEKK